MEITSKVSHNVVASEQLLSKKVKRGMVRGMVVPVVIAAIALLVYYYTMISAVSPLIENSSSTVKFISQSIPTWFIISILMHLYFMRSRTSYAMELLTKQCSLLDREIESSQVQTSKSVNGPGDVTQLLENMDRTSHQLDTASTSEKSEDYPKKDWHICFVCKIFVPEQTWHCDLCEHCILRRCHHCLVSSTCIGERNQANFLGFLLYVAIGSTYAYIFGALHQLKFNETPIWQTFLKSWNVLYCLYDFTVLNLLCAIVFATALASFIIFVKYFEIALQGLTVYQADKGPGVNIPYSYDLLKNFLGPFPICKIFIPFMSSHKIFYQFDQRLKTK